MNRINVFIDGSWLFELCRPYGFLAKRTDDPAKAFNFYFVKFDALLKFYIGKISKNDDLEMGDRYLCTSIFNLDKDIIDGVVGNHWCASR